MLDKTLINLSSLIISGAGLYSALTKYSVPQLNNAFWGLNPFAVKRDIIDSVMTTIFTLLTMIGLILQAFLFVFEDRISERQYDVVFYLWYLAIGAIFISIIVWLLSLFGKWLARCKWKPVIVESQYELYLWTLKVIENGGIYEEVKNANREEIIFSNYKTADERMEQFESLFEIKQKSEDRIIRINKIGKYFKK